MRVRHRHVIYVQGYDPRGLPEYYRLFRHEYRRSRQLYGLKGEVTRPAEIPGRSTMRWRYDTSGDGWHVMTTYDFLRWEDIIRRDFARPAWWKLLHMVGVFLRAVLNGTFARIARAHWRFGCFTAYPFLVLLGHCLLAVIVGAAVFRSSAALAPPVSVAAGCAAAAVSFVLSIWLTEPLTYLLYLCDDMVATYQFAHNQRPDWVERFELFAHHIVDVARGSNADEIVVVGHSSGSFVAVDVLCRALAHDPDLGKHGQKVSLLTIGANLPIVGFNPEAQWFRDRLKRLAIEPSILWVDYQSRHDIMNFYPFDPIEGHRIALGAERNNPIVVPVSFRTLWPAEGFNRRRWRFFRAHFQFLMANERPGAAYDYYLICCGPLDLETRARKPDEASIATPPPSAAG